MKKRMIAGLMAVLMTMSLAACGSSAGSSDASGTGSAATGDNSAAQAASGDKVTLSLCWWGNQTRNDVTKKAVDLYMEQNPNVEIKVEFTLEFPYFYPHFSAFTGSAINNFQKITKI